MQSKVIRRRRLAAAALAAAPLLGGGIEYARGINITLTYDAANSLEPSYDPTGAQLTVLMNHIASFYEDVFEDTHAVSITYRWADLNPGIGGLHSLQSQSGGRENSMLVQLNSFNGATEVDWYMDQTPADDSEYDMQQILWRDLTPTQRTNFYNAGANIPQTFEAGFQGNARTTAPASAQNDPDGLSVMFQEVGHGLGMSAANLTTQSETLDDDYDYDSVNLFGRTLAARTRSGTDIAHIANPFGVMFGSAGSGERTRPTHNDLLSMAAVHIYQSPNLDIPRREFYGGSDWNTAANWTGNRTPDFNDEAFIRASGPAGEARSASLSASASVGTLTLAEGSDLQTNGFQLTVNNAMVVDGLNTDLFVETGGTLTMSSATLTIQNQGELNMTGGVVNAGTLSNRAEIIGNGTINITNRLINAGSLNVVTGTMTINATGTGSIDLDGFNTGTIIIIGEPGDVAVTTAGSDLVVNGSLTDDFNGVMTIGNSNSVTMNDAWTLGGNSGTIVFTSDGQLNLNGGTTSATAAVLTGAIVTIEGDVNVGTNSYGSINAATAFVGGEIHIQSNGTLDLNGNNSFNGGTYDGAGTIKFDGNTNVIGDTTMDIANVDLDGDTINDTFTVNNGVTFTINGNITDDLDEALVVNGALLVNGPSWGLFNGSLTLNSGTVGGTAGFRNNSNGIITVGAGASAIATTSNFGGSASQIINGTLRLQGNSVVNGGTWSGTGMLSLDDQATTFTGNTTLNMATLDMDGLINGTGSINVNSGVTVSVNSTISDAFDATLNVNSGTMDLNTGSFIINAGGVVNLTDTGAGTATFIAPGVTNNTGGTINFNGGASNGFGGGGEGGGPEAVTGGGRLNAGTFVNNGRVNVLANSGGFISGSSTFNAAGSVVVNAGGQLVIDGTSNFAGGSFGGTGILTQDANVTVSANTTIGVTTFDWDGDFFGNTTVNSGVMLTINSTSIENDGNAHDSNVTLNSGSVTVNTAGAWAKAGNLILANTGGGVPNVLGQPMISSGTISSTGATQMSAQLINGGGTLVTNLGSTHTSVGGFRTTVLNTFTKSGSGNWTVTGPQSHVANSVLNITAGNVNFNSDAGGGGANLRVNHNGLNFNMNTSQHLARLDIGAGATATINPAGNDNVLRTNVLTIAGGAAPTGTLNLADETMIYDYSGATPIIAVRDWLLSGYNGNTWTGDGIRSSFAAADPANRALGYVEATNIGSPATFAGEAIDGTTIIVRATLPGDTNLDRTVNISDFAILASNFNTPQFWAGGDFDYNFLVNISDFALLAAHFNQVIPADLPRGGNVPEPAVASVLALGAGLMARRRRAC